MASDRAFSRDEFQRRLEADDLEPPFTVAGMVKKAEDGGGYFLFSMGDCESWAKVPLNAIASAEPLGVLPCREHSHAVVRLEFATPTDENAWAFSLLKGMRRTAARLTFLDAYGEGGGDPETKKPEYAATSGCTRCIRRCGTTHQGDPIGYMLCALNCPCP
ncbi:hypothetical protein P0Y31_09345 [Knoellia sp. 3-2P3]|uniref:hypothetical protein n=1 Tax=unclassified Knoellia TaxID=2618719 RepID=UPI0023DAD15D|nr:hypothetical protein [Knoellia sp. 3-2P3]MDF2092548.1 hypothetical protein [Knoellia sp. 3-2P3]